MDMYEANIYAIICRYMEKVEDEKEKKQKDDQMIRTTQLMQGALAIQVQKTKEELENKKVEESKEKILGKLGMKFNESNIVPKRMIGKPVISIMPSLDKSHKQASHSDT